MEQLSGLFTLRAKPKVISSFIRESNVTLESDHSNEIFKQALLSCRLFLVLNVKYVGNILLCNHFLMVLFVMLYQVSLSRLGIPIDRVPTSK